MPRYPIKPLIQLSKEQWKVLLERVMQKEGKLTTKGAGAIMSRPFEPPVTQEVGALFKDMPIGAGGTTRQVERLPIEQARAKYLANPEQYVTPSMSAPEAKVMSQVPSGSSEELAAGIAYERVKQVPIVPQVSKTVRTMQKEIESQELEGAVRRLGVSPEDIRPGVKPQTIIEEMGRKPKEMITVPPAAELAADGDIADMMWRKDAKGGRTLFAKVWEMYRSSSRQKSHISTARDYFISSFVRWRQAPKHFTRAYPREAKLLEQSWKEFEISLQPPPVAIPRTNLPSRAGGGVAVGGVD